MPQEEEEGEEEEEEEQEKEEEEDDDDDGGDGDDLLGTHLAAAPVRSQDGPAKLGLLHQGHQRLGDGLGVGLGVGLRLERRNAEEDKG